MSRFDKEAAAWDSNPTTVKSSRQFFESITARLSGLTDGGLKSCTAIEIGCGTGLLTVQLAPFLSTYYAYDTSQGMIDVLQTKLPKLPPGTEIKPVKELLTDPKSASLHGNQVDLAFSHLTLHHIPDSALQSTYQLLYDVLTSGGRVYLSDFEFTKDSEHFHPKAKHYDVERHGMKPADIIAGLEAAGFRDVRVEHNFDLPKPCEDGKTRIFPFLIATGCK